MRTSTVILCAGLTLSARPWMGAAQETSGPIPHSPTPPQHQPFATAGLDANKDSVIDSTELANASTALKALDLNGNGSLEMDEIQPLLPHARTRPPGPSAHVRRPPQPVPAAEADSIAPPPPPPHADAEGKPLPPMAPPVPVIVMALDANQDGIVDAAELASAPVALEALDKNGDGQLTAHEYNPQRQPGPRKVLRHRRSGSGQDAQSGPEHRSVPHAHE
ncbi:MAG: hypothetical protein AB9869_30430 [Verrucomicrobiia bacterium]